MKPRTCCWILVWFAWACLPARSLAAESPATLAQRQAVDEVLRRLSAALTAADEPAVLALYDTADAGLLARTRSELQVLNSRAARRVDLRVGSVRDVAGDIEAIVLRSVSHEEHQRRQMQQRWQRWRLHRIDAAWRVAAQDDWEGARTLSNDLSIELRPQQRTLVGEAKLTVAVTQAGADSVLLELNRGLAITSITDAQRQPVKFERTATAIEVRPARALRADERRVFIVRFAGSLFNEAKEQGFSQVSISPAGSFASWVTAWYPHLVGSGSKATGQLQYLVPSGIKVASNGKLQNVTHSAAGERYTFTVTHPLDFSFAAANYQQRTARMDEVQVSVYLLKADAAKAEMYEQGTARLLRLQRDFFGAYPFDGYAVVEIPAEETGALGGSSEQGMNFFPSGVLKDSSFPLPLVAHEMGHSWWGNLVKSRDNAMLDEGLAQLAAVLCVLDFDGEAAMRRFLKAGYPDYGQSANAYFRRFAQPPGRDYPLGMAPGSADAAAALHDLADTKGMMVYSMLRDLIGQPALLRALREVIARFADREATLEDLRAALQKASGRDLEQFFQQWFARTGAPELALTSSIAAQGNAFRVSGAITQSSEPYELDVEVVLAAAGRKVTHSVHVAGASSSFSFDSEFRPEWVVLDPQYKVLRWTPELRNRQILEEGRVLTALGKSAAAIDRLQDYLQRAPDSLTGRNRLGVAFMEAGQLPRAEAAFRRVLDYYASLQVFEPAVTASQLDLGRVLDLQGRREQALAAYRQVLTLPDEDDAHRDARAALVTPYTLPVRAAGPSRETLVRYLGDYASPQGIALKVTLSPLEVLQLEPASGGTLLLEWIEGGRFRPSGSADTVLEFGEAGSLTLMSGGTVIRLQRRQ